MFNLLLPISNFPQIDVFNRQILMNVFDVFPDISGKTGSMIAVGALEGLFDVTSDRGFNSSIATNPVNAPLVI